MALRLNQRVNLLQDLRVNQVDGLHLNHRVNHQPSLLYNHQGNQVDNLHHNLLEAQQHSHRRLPQDNLLLSQHRSHLRLPQDNLHPNRRLNRVGNQLSYPVLNPLGSQLVNLLDSPRDNLQVSPPGVLVYNQQCNRQRNLQNNPLEILLGSHQVNLL